MSIDCYLSGARLYGDDMSREELVRWFSEEEEGYANLGAADRGSYAYEYHASNQIHGYRYLGANRFKSVLGFGSAYGDELLPIIDRIDDLVIVDPSGTFRSGSVHGHPVKYVKPTVDGILPFQHNAFDLITCFGVLHHIPNVSAVMTELSRILMPGGTILLREPIVSMGDWREPRHGLTKNERGIPLAILRDIVENQDLEIVLQHLIGFPPIEHLFKLAKLGVHNSRFCVIVDYIFSSIFSPNLSYHANTVFRKFRPTSVFMNLRKKMPDVG